MEIDRDEFINQTKLSIEEYDDFKTLSDLKVLEKNISINNHYITDAFYKYGIKNYRYPEASFYLIETNDELKSETILEIEKKIFEIFKEQFTKSFELSEYSKINIDSFYQCYFENLKKNYNNIILEDKIDTIPNITKKCIKNDDQKSNSFEQKSSKILFKKIIKFNKDKNVDNLKDKLVLNSIIYFLFFCITFSLFFSINFNKRHQ
tara:strand:- start:1022 stop:1639 length:618 start_codon:yes stop_codon:yes gene_type:complete